MGKVFEGLKELLPSIEGGAEIRFLDPRTGRTTPINSFALERLPDGRWCVQLSSGFHLHSNPNPTAPGGTPVAVAA